jgi:hypothetical protein
MNNNNSSTKGVNRARQANGKGNKSRPSSNAKLVTQSSQNSGRQQSTVSVGVANSRQQKSARPKVVQSSQHCRVNHRELIGSVEGSSGFTVEDSFALNPGIALSFPWLSGIARNWEQYKFNKLRYCYYPRTGTSTPGSFMMAPDYDAADVAPVSEQVASSYVDSVEDAPWKEIICHLKPDRLKGISPFKYVRTETLGANLDIKTYDSGNIHIITLDGTAVSWGKLWVEYDVEFKIPQIRPTGQLIVAGGKVNGLVSLTPANPMGTAPLIDAEAIGVSLDSASRLTLQYPGTYLISFYLTGTTVSALTLTNVNGSTVASLGSVVNAAGTIMLGHWSVVTSVNDATIDITATAAAVSQDQLYIASAPLSSLA